MNYSREIYESTKDQPRIPYGQKLPWVSDDRWEQIVEESEDEYGQDCSPICTDGRRLLRP